MRKIVIILVLSGIFACEDDQNLFFNAEHIDDLDLANLEFFWQSGSDIDTTYTGGEMFVHDPGHIAGKRFYSEDRYILFTVFGSQSEAINAIQQKIGTVACVIEKGTTDAVKDMWWFSKCAPNSVFVIKLNTLTQVSIQSVDFASAEEILYRTSNEIAARVLKYSN